MVEIFIPAAKCKGEDLRPAVSLAFTLLESTIDLTLFTSPLLQASKRSRSGSVGEILSGLQDRDIFIARNAVPVNTFCTVPLDLTSF